VDGQAPAGHPRLLKSVDSGVPLNRIIPQFGFIGSKARLQKWILSVFPLHCDRYVDVFTGRGNVFFAAAQLRYYPKFWLNDWRTAPFLRALRNPDFHMPIRITNDLYRRIQAADELGRDS
jgi:D12 class N6 adenine-specific DNA methyltransferase